MKLQFHYITAFEKSDIHVHIHTNTKFIPYITTITTSKSRGELKIPYE